MYLRYTFIIAFLWTGFLTFLGKAPFLFMVTMGTSASEFSSWFSLIIAGLIGGILLSKKMANNWSTEKSIQLGVAISLCAALLLGGSFFWVFTPVTIVVSMFLYLFGLGIILPPCQAAATEIFPSTHAGIAFGLMYFVKMLGGSAGVFFMSYIGHDTSLAFASLMIICAFCSMSCALFNPESEVSPSVSTLH